ncbi:MAG: hypothetical protein H6738_02300 [Alphaproteobacteria bacterium]|nr:hypothetical protein [Alphaproteobacteria bacterium]
MSAAVVAVSVRSPAGDLDALMDRLDRRAPATSEPPYALTGLPARPCGIVEGLERDRPAEELLLAVVSEVLAGRPLEGTGLVVGTASGNVCGPWERANRARVEGLAPDPADLEDDGRDGPTLRIARRLGLTGPVTTVSVVCVSGAAALGVALGWLRDGRCERVVVAGLDALCEFVHAGFAGLGAVGQGTPRPFREDRDGLMLGEGAAALLLERAPTTPALAWLRASRASCDAHHMTTPDPSGAGAASAITAALTDAGLSADDVDGVSVHGTATRANDAMEAAALTRVFGASPPPWAVKAVIGHTMGAAGAIEAAVAAEVLHRGRLPALLDPTVLLDVAVREGPPRVVLAMSSAFGGTNVANLLADAPGPAFEADRMVVRTGEVVRVVPRGDDVWPDAPVAWFRANDYVRAGLIALRDLGGAWPSDTALVLASRTNCVEVDRAHHDRIVAEGSGRASRRAFVGTLPAAPIAEAALLWGLHGPVLAFVDEYARAEEEAERLVRHGRASAAVALGIELAGERYEVRALRFVNPPRAGC